MNKVKEDQGDSTMSESYYPSLHSRTLSDLSVDEILFKYQDNSQLLNHILVAKAQEDKRRTAEEMRQVEEARLQTKYIEFELTHRQENNNAYAQNADHGTASIFDTSFMDHQDQFTDPIDNGSSLKRMDNSPLFNSSDFQYTMQPPESTTSVSSSPLSTVDFMSPSNFDLYGENMIVSSSPPPSEDLPLFPPTTTTTTTTSSSKSSKSNKGKKKSTSTSSPTTKNMHRTLSYESVMTLSDLNIRPKSVSPPPPPPPPQPPLDHDKVMEALRAKLRKSSSPYQNNRRKPSPEPVVPPPNTYPTTGVLLLNLKNRRRKTSVTKRSSSAK
ncbi:hypothetical protein BD770DRAFT_414179 [Pilaira anomala]|nr:hypothetical protein BD770DRAFT_414179 [Pilaira anomala]